MVSRTFALCSRRGTTVPAPRILAAALEDISSIADYHLRRVGPQAAEAVTDRLLDTIALLDAAPCLGPLHHDSALQSMGYRKLVCGHYVCVYRIVDGVPLVYRVFHESQSYSTALLDER